MNKICKDELCTGCSACANKCPHHCILMTQDQEGFYRPMINLQKCVDCGLCRKTCPANRAFEDDVIKPLSYAAQCIDEEIRASSSSGGVFTLLAEAVLNMGGVVFGAGFDSNFNVIHKAVTSEYELKELRGSKYVQSKIGGIYKEAKDILEQGLPVLFTGTPCQIGGLYSYLTKEYANLYTQDIICHGVPSPLSWKKYLEYRENVADSAVVSAEFRNKNSGWKQYSMVIGFRNGETYQKRNVEDPFLRAFIMNMTLRKSCENCLFKTIHRQADITLSDFWGIEEVMPEWNDNKGTSIIMIHSKKGNYLLSLIKRYIRFREVSFDSFIQYNPSMIQSVGYNVLRKRFIKEIGTTSFEQVFHKYCGEGTSSKLRRKFALVIRKIKVIL